ncbi:hypothetical protein PUNSTDRAFT_51432 [Punctularia strigosozonata HHB-11173 SS5]|uniref:uncharacterized protein n=1 Tax=Punctularia strigosozonata (strain HHB-11173) TaxID=741275 RepID=UPI0004416F22|nr:uncharacterized protein PUNSTDRAFT_51432 [Punctularia strigosozonata HHB-11173 SS5]EIN10842.1 hypothetical protein PUNSTDRAFT_51432 [Punctularia strigosozonata HHB-11173 SS5]
MDSTYTRSPPRPRHRKRASLRLSTDSSASTLSLPVYTSPPPAAVPQTLWEDPPSDKPPDYPDSAEEADESDSDNHQRVYLPLRSVHSPPLSPRRRLPRRKPADSQLDSLLERSIQALEMSNTLLQSSMSTQTSLSTLLAPEPLPADAGLDARAHALSARISRNREVYASWMDDMDDMAEQAAGLYAELEPEPVSQSLPTSSSMPTTLRERRHRPRMSMDSRRHALSETTALTLSNHDRNDFVSPAPRALTVYVNSTDDPEAIALPSTLGLRSSPSKYPSPCKNQDATPTRPYIHSTASTSCLPDRSSTSSTPKAHSVLSSFLKRSPSPASSTFNVFRRNSISSDSRSSRRSSLNTPSPTRHRRGSDSSTSRSRSVTPKRADQTPLPVPRIMTAIEELPSSQSSQSSSDHDDTHHAHRTLESLRKIMDAQPQPPALTVSSTRSTSPNRIPRPRFMPLTAPPSPSAGTSNTTASVSRLLTKNQHMTSTRARSPPKQSSLKRRPENLSAPPTPSPLTPTHSMFGILPTRAASAASSGRSTPKRISFAELPESYAQSKPGGPDIKFKEKKKRKGKGKGKESQPAGSWWTSWLLGSSASSSLAGVGREERLEERMAGKAWGSGGRPGYGGFDDWGM